MNNPYFSRAKRRAGKVLKDDSKLQSVLLNVGKKLGSGNLEISRMGDKLKLLVRMVKAYVSGNYKVVPWKSIMVITGVLVYFVMPLDLIADFIPVTGYIDDFSLVLWVFSHLQDDIDTFSMWEDGSLDLGNIESE
jgi:uncharacterized membrane protein YkvA (DUF1232 family)